MKTIAFSITYNKRVVLNLPELELPKGQITHSIQQARRMARQVAFLHQGKLIEQGETDLVPTKPSRAETKQFLDFYGF